MNPGGREAPPLMEGCGWTAASWDHLGAAHCSAWVAGGALPATLRRPLKAGRGRGMDAGWLSTRGNDVMAAPRPGGGWAGVAGQV